MRFSIKKIIFWGSGVLSIVTFIANAIRFPDSLEVVMNWLPESITKDWVRLILGTASFFYICGITWFLIRGKQKVSQKENEIPILKTTKIEQTNIFLAFVSIYTKVTNFESFVSCGKELNEKCSFLRDCEAIFEASDIKQDYRDFMHSASIAIDCKKRYSDNDEKHFVLNLISTSFKNLEKALR